MVVVATTPTAALATNAGSSSPGKLLGKKKATGTPTSGAASRKVKQAKRVERESSGDEAAEESSGKGMKKKEEIEDTGLSRKRMASLNASAFMAATYEAEQTLDRNLSATETSSDEEEDEDEDEDDTEEGDNKSQNTDTDAKSQQSLASAVSKAKSSAGSARSSGTASSCRKGAKKVKKELMAVATGDDAKNVSNPTDGL